MINLNQSIAKVKAEIYSALRRTRAEDDPPEPNSRDVLIEIIMHEGAGKDRKTLLKWLNARVDAMPVEAGSDAPTEPPVYRPEKRGNVWCVLDTANGKLRLETFAVKGDAKAFITRLEQDVNGLIEERPFHYLRSE